jgi:hypothetical protein
MHPRIFWEFLEVPITFESEQSWIPIRDLSSLVLSEKPLINYKGNQGYINLPNTISMWAVEEPRDEFGNPSAFVHEIINSILGICRAELNNSEIQFIPQTPPEDILDFQEKAISIRFFRHIQGIPYAGDLEQMITLKSNHYTMNLNHSFVKLALSKKDSDDFIYARGDLVLLAKYLIIRSHDNDFEQWFQKADSSNYHSKQIWVLYDGIDWNSVKPELRPPYKFYRNGTLTVEIDHEFFNRLAF